MYRETETAAGLLDVYMRTSDHVSQQNRRLAELKIEILNRITNRDIVPQEIEIRTSDDWAIDFNRPTMYIHKVHDGVRVATSVRHSIERVSFVDPDGARDETASDKLAVYIAKSYAGGSSVVILDPARKLGYDEG